MNILFISTYPNEFDKSNSIFVYNLIQELTKLDCNIVVVSPQTWRKKRKNFKSNKGLKDYGNETAIVLRPKYFDFPNSIRFKEYSLGRLNLYTYNKAVFKCLKKLDFTPDVVYGHFLFRAGASALAVSKFLGIPSIVALGESSLEKYTSIYSKKIMKKTIQQFSGIISVSEVNKSFCSSVLNVRDSKIKVVPNAVNSTLFYPRNKEEMRMKYNLPQEAFIIAFTGHFIDRKGPLRVLEALDRIDGNIGGIFIGSGNQTPVGEKVFFVDSVPQSIVPELLSAADIFVLPTVNEGSCNAIIEAMACGLPIVSSNIDAIKEQVNNKNSILCEPYGINEISDAILRLYNNNLLVNKMKVESLKLSESLTLNARATIIRNYLLEVVNEKYSNLKGES